MGLFFSLVALLALILLAMVGAAVPGLNYVFGVIIPYAAIAAFIIGVIMRVVKWSKSPVPFRITTTCGQQKSLDFIRQNKLDNPSSGFGAFMRMFFEVFAFRSLFRNTKAQLKEGRLVYGESKWLWLFAILFHYSFLVIFLRHFRFFVEPVPFFVKLIQDLDGFFQIGVPILYITNGLIFAALFYLFFRRVLDQKVKYISLSSDYFPLLLIGTIAVTGVLMRYFYKTDLIAVKELAVGILSFSPILPAGLSSMFYIHLFLVSILLAYIPMSKLAHLPGIFLSPTRNLANNNRSSRHVNPWNPVLKVHTYEEYENEFRNVMIEAGIPVDKEEN